MRWECSRRASLQSSAAMRTVNWLLNQFKPPCRPRASPFHFAVRFGRGPLTHLARCWATSLPHFARRAPNARHPSAFLLPLTTARLFFFHFWRFSGGAAPFYGATSPTHLRNVWTQQCVGIPYADSGGCDRCARVWGAHQARGLCRGRRATPPTRFTGSGAGRVIAPPFPAHPVGGAERPFPPTPVAHAPIGPRKNTHGEIHCLESSRLPTVAASKLQALVAPLSHARLSRLHQRGCAPPPLVGGRARLDLVWVCGMHDGAGAPRPPALFCAGDSPFVDRALSRLLFGGWVPRTAQPTEFPRLRLMLR